MNVRPPVLLVTTKCSISHKYRALGFVLAIDVVDADLLELLLQVLVVSRLSASDFITEVICKSKGVQIHFVMIVCVSCLSGFSQGSVTPHKVLGN